MRVHYAFDTSLPPEAVVAALTDFSESRPNIWPNLDPTKYQVHEHSQNSAVVTEGNRRPNIWARERYDWSVPGRVSWKAEDSNFWAPGSGVVATVSASQDGGSRVTIDWKRTPTSLLGYVAMLSVRIGKDRVLGYKTALDKLAHTDSSSLLRAA
ncbi:MAG: SRPBCC family protein [Thermoleophilia bacterium]|nr:SRPBCC family protein [Thermoleophilia bacterium]